VRSNAEEVLREVIARSSTLPTTDDIELDGNATVTLVYL
jgi:hypothetical protein